MSRLGETLRELWRRLSTPLEADEAREGQGTDDRDAVVATEASSPTGLTSAGAPAEAAGADWPEAEALPAAEIDPLAAEAAPLPDERPSEPPRTPLRRGRRLTETAPSDLFRAPSSAEQATDDFFDGFVRRADRR